MVRAVLVQPGDACVPLLYERRFRQPEFPRLADGGVVGLVQRVQRGAETRHPLRLDQCLVGLRHEIRCGDLLLEAAGVRQGGVHVLIAGRQPQRGHVNAGRVPRRPAKADHAGAAGERQPARCRLLVERVELRLDLGDGAASVPAVAAGAGNNQLAVRANAVADIAARAGRHAALGRAEHRTPGTACRAADQPADDGADARQDHGANQRATNGARTGADRTARPDGAALRAHQGRRHHPGAKAETCTAQRLAIGHASQPHRRRRRRAHQPDRLEPAERLGRRTRECSLAKDRRPKQPGQAARAEHAPQPRQQGPTAATAHRRIQRRPRTPQQAIRERVHQRQLGQIRRQRGHNAPGGVREIRRTLLPHQKGVHQPRAQPVKGIFCQSPDRLVRLLPEPLDGLLLLLNKPSRIILPALGLGRTAIVRLLVGLLPEILPALVERRRVPPRSFRGLLRPPLRLGRVLLALLLRGLRRLALRLQRRPAGHEIANPLLEVRPRLGHGLGDLRLRHAALAQGLLIGVELLGEFCEYLRLLLLAGSDPIQRLQATGPQRLDARLHQGQVGIDLRNRRVARAGPALFLRPLILIQGAGQGTIPLIQRLDRLGNLADFGPLFLQLGRRRAQAA